MDDIDRMIELTASKRELQAKLRAIEAQIAETGRRVSDSWLSTGTSKITRNGATVYLSREMSARLKDPDDALAAILGTGLEHLVGVGVSRLKAWLRETLHDDVIGDWSADPSRIPPGLRDHIEIGEYHRVNVRGAQGDRAPDTEGTQ